MRIETILNAYLTAEIRLDRKAPRNKTFKHRRRQADAFRDRIIKMFEEKDAAYTKIDKAFDKYIELKDADFEEMNTKIIYQEKQLAEKDARIAELKAENQAMEYLLNEGENIGVE